MIYDPNVSKIKNVEVLKSSMKKTIDLVQSAEIEWERLKQLNYTGLLSQRSKPIKQMAQSLVSAVSKVGSGLTGKKVSDTIKSRDTRNSLIESALIEAISSIFPRAVGPIEEIPASQLMDSVRRKIILTKTQIRKEQELIANFMQARRNKYVKNPEAIKKISIPGISPIGQYTRSTGINNPKFGYNNEVFPFSILNLASGKRESFPPFISTLNESISTSWNEVNFINRSEGVPIYQGASRSFTMDFLLFATTGNEEVSVSLKEAQKEFGFPIYPQPIEGIDKDVIDFITKQDMWRKINFLHQCNRPSYTDGLFSKAPYCRLTIGHLFQDILMTIDGISLNYDPLIWDLNKDKITSDPRSNEEKPPLFRGLKPMIVSINMTGKLYHGAPPHSNYTFYLDKEEQS